ncbi:MAG TPA: zinc-ribbon domain-containing protein [Planctomycetaceae bacterium]|jgi:predicted Zn finger-like uncharacterized protein
MPDELRVGCPECGTTYRLKSRQSVGRKMNCRNCGEAFVARLQEDDPDFEPQEDHGSSSDEWHPAGRLPARRRKSGKDRRKTRSRRSLWLDWRIAAAAGAVLVVVGLVIAFLNIPFARGPDTPDAVYRDLAAAMRDIRNTFDSIRDAGSQKSAIEKFKGMKPRFEDLILRACRLEPVPEQEYKDLAARYKDSLEWERKDKKEVSQRISNAGQGGLELLAAVPNLGRQYYTAVDVLHDALLQPVEPRDAAERIQYDVLQIKRRLIRRLATVSSSAELPATVADCKTAAASIDELSFSPSSSPCSGRHGTRRTDPRLVSASHPCRRRPPSPSSRLPAPAPPWV